MSGAEAEHRVAKGRGAALTRAPNVLRTDAAEIMGTDNATHVRPRWGGWRRKVSGAGPEDFLEIGLSLLRT